MKTPEKRYECPLCRSCPTEEEWNEYNRIAIITFGSDPLPEGLEGGQFDCPSCKQYVSGEDLLEF
ncbi:hypothetical protein COA01_30080 [Bacillus cereus]|uniref:hypothetical protein n=1 Tax=Bacillus cereus TaxID=1396 RepID=UPI000BFC6C7B|nr:hypothetical protein [Bacillus cereus]PGP14604.1 hypothetical protein COA01_30080 [Bacillus cereus]